MKKLLALVLSLCLVLTMFSGTLGVFAADEATVLTPKAYEGTLPNAYPEIFSFEGATLDSNGFSWNTLKANYGEGKADYSIANEGAQGNNSLKIEFSEGKTKFGVASKLVDLPDDLYDSNTRYVVTAKVKTTDDFDGHLNIGFLKGANSLVSNQQYSTENYTLDTALKVKLPKTGYSDDATMLDDWTTVSARKHDCSYSGAQVVSWLTAAGSGLYLSAYATTGTLWVDDVDIVPYTHDRDYYNGVGSYTGVFTTANAKAAYAGTKDEGYAGGQNNGGFEKSAGYQTDARYHDISSSNNGTVAFIDSYGQKWIEATTDAETGEAIPAVWAQDIDIREIAASDTYASRNGVAQINWDIAHNGFYSIKVYKNRSNVSSFAFYYPSANINAEKDYYMEAWVKLDDYNGAVSATVANPTYSTINTPISWFGSNYMLGSDKISVTKDDVGDGWLHITSAVMDGAVIAEKATGQALNFYLNLIGTGLIYIDDVNLVEIDDNTPVISNTNFYGNVNFQKVEITTAGDADIWFTTDGSNPLYSATAMRYDTANPIRIYDGLYLRAVGIDKVTGDVSDIISKVYNAPANLYKIREGANTGNVCDDKAPVYYNDLVLPADAAAGDIVRLTYEETTSKNDNGSYNFTTKDAVMQFRGYNMNNSVNVSFDVTAAEGFTGETWVKLWLNGGGEFKAEMNGETVAGTFVGKNGYVAKVTSAGKQTVTLKLEGLQRHDAMAPYIERISGSGAVTVDNFKVTIDQIGLPAISVVEDEAPELDYYFDDQEDNEDYLKSDVWPSFTNKSAYALKGKMDLIYTAQDGEEVYSTSFDINLAPGQATKNLYVDLGALIETYGAYNVQYVFTDVSGRKFVCLEKSIAYLPDNSASTSFRGVNLGVFTQGYKDAFAQLELVKNLGMNYVRTEIRMENANLVTVGEDGSYTLADTVLEGAEAAQDAGIKLVVLLNASYTTVDANEFAKFAAAAKAQLAGYGIEYFELINEPNGGDAAKYAAIVKAAYPVLADDNTKVVAGNVSHHGSGWLEGMIAAEGEDILKCIDIWAVHPYVHNNFSPTATWEDATFHEYLATLKAEKLDPNGIELWAGEFGYPTADTCQRDKTGLYEFGFDEEYAEYTLRQYLGLEAAGYGAAIQYVYSGDNNYWGEQSFGLVAKEDKTAVAALSAYTYFTEGFDFVEQTVVDGVYTNKYTNANGEVVYAVWTTEGEKEATVSVPAYDYGVADMYGKKGAAAKTPNGDAFDLTVTATAEPVWVVDYVEPYVEPASTEYIQFASFENCTTSDIWVPDNKNLTRAMDTVIKYDGAQSHKYTFSAAGYGRNVMTLNLNNIDVNRQYIVRFKYRLLDFKGTINAYVYNDKVSYVNQMYQSQFSLPNQYIAEEITTSDWITFESDPFAIIAGDQFRIGFQFQNENAAGATVWLDRFELVPVDTTDKHGKVTVSKDSEGNVIVTATPDEGYAVLSLDVKGQRNNDYTVYNMKNEFVSEDLATRAKSYKLDFVAANDETKVLDKYYRVAAYQPITAIFVPADELPIDPLGDDALLGNGSLEETQNVRFAPEGCVTLDATTAVDGATSLKLDWTDSNYGTTYYVDLEVDRDKLATLDSSINYKLRFYVKGDNYNGQLGIDGTPRGIKEDGSLSSDLFYFGQIWGDNMPILNPGTVGEKWTVIETKEFPVFGEYFAVAISANNNTAGGAGSLWIDRVELVPVEENTTNGVITTSYDEATGKLVATVKANDGYMPTGLTITSNINGNGTWDHKTGTATVFAQPAVDEISYLIDFGEGGKFMYTQTYDMFVATYEEIPAAEAIVVGDATGDGEVDILDLVRTKNFELGNTTDIEYVNVWYACEDDDYVIDAAQLAALRKLIWNKF